MLEFFLFLYLNFFIHESISLCLIFQNYNSLDAEEPVKCELGKNNKTGNTPSNGTLVSNIERMMKKHMDNLMHAIDNMSSRLSQLETRTRNLEHSIDDLKISVGNNHGTIDGKMRLLENILTEVPLRIHNFPAHISLHNVGNPTLI